MGLLIHRHHHHYRTAIMAPADLAAMLMVVERGLDFAGPVELEGYPCEWCGQPHGRSHRGATLCAGCIAELDARGSEPRLMRTDAEIDAMCDAGANVFARDDTHDDEANRWEDEE